MPTYQDITARVRALINDLPNHYADDNLLLVYANMAQGQLMSHLISNGVREGVQRTVMFIPAGTSRIERWPAVQVMPNERTYSNGFTMAAPPTGWAAIGTAPAVSTGLSDPEGGLNASAWTFAAGGAFDLYTTGVSTPPMLSYGGSASIWARSPSAATPFNATVYAGIADNGGPIAETLAYKEVRITSEWQRVFVPFEGKTITAAPVGSLCRCISLAGTLPAGGVIQLYQCVIRPGFFDTPDVTTNGVGSTNGREPILPDGIIIPDRILERKPGAASNAWTLVRGPVVIRDFPGSERITQWDWRAGGIDIGPCQIDREILMEFWGEVRDSQLGTNVLEDELPIPGSLEAMSTITAGLVAQAREQHSSAAIFGVMQRDGSFSGAAGGLLANLVNTFNKAQQSEPTRRQPYFGVARYPGVAGNMIGGWPWNSN